ncbi:hypothetical protein HBI65_185500 [Parastagonospora nodorum]|nr:hypothetical protein HBI65_185500 [Parastagonospora nodorum]
MLLCWTIKSLSISSADKYSKKHLEVREADASKQRLELEAQLRKASEEEELAKTKKEKREKEAWEREAGLDSLLDSDDYRLDSSLDIDSEDDSEDEEATTAKDLNEGRSLCKSRDGNGTLHSGRNKRTIKLPACWGTEVQNARAEGDATEHNAVDDDDKLCPTEGERTFYCADLLALRFCFFSDSPPENMGRLTKEEVMEMRIDTTDAISKALAAANKLVALRSYVLGGFVIVCGFRKVDKHVFRAYNTISVTAQRTIIRKGGSYVEKRAILLPSYVTVWGRTVFDEFHNCKSEGIIMAKLPLNGLAMAKQWRNMIANVKHDASEHESSYDTVQNAEQQCRDILEKEGLDESEASRRVIFNCFEMQAIASYSALATLKAAQFKTYSSCKVKRFTLNSVKDLFTNLSKDYFLSIAAEDAAKAANTLLPPKEVRAKILIESYKPIVQAVTWLGLREKFGNESVLVMQGDGPWIMVALIAFAEAITLTEATHVVIMEPQDRQNTQD